MAARRPSAGSNPRRTTPASSSSSSTPSSSSRASRPGASGRSGRPTRGGRGSSSSSGTGWVVGGFAVVAIGVIGYFAFGSSLAKEEPKPEPKPPAVEAKKEEPTPPPKVPAGREGKTPDRPAPALSQVVLDEADALYEKANKLNTEANRAQKSGDSAKFNDLINDCWETLVQLDEVLTVYNEWVDEAELYSWAIPGEYLALQQRYSRYDKLKGSVRRVRPNRR